MKEVGRFMCPRLWWQPSSFQLSSSRHTPTFNLCIHIPLGVGFRSRVRQSSYERRETVLKSVTRVRVMLGTEEITAKELLGKRGGDTNVRKASTQGACQNAKVGWWIAGISSRKGIELVRTTSLPMTTPATWGYIICCQLGWCPWADPRCSDQRLHHLSNGWVRSHDSECSQSPYSQEKRWLHIKWTFLTQS